MKIINSFILSLCTINIAAASKPNIILILADDMGYADIGLHGCKDIPTPNIDRIGKEGVRFTASYANGAYCTPTRVALMSGRYQQRTGNDDLTSVTGPLPKQVKTLADRLREAGYITGMIGKWHLGEDKGYLPLDRGFDEFYGFHGGGHSYFTEKIDPAKPKRGYDSPIYRQNKPIKETRYLTDAFGEESAAFLKRHRASKKPIFLYLAFNAVHTPMDASGKHLKKFPDLPKGKRKTYAAMLSAMDDAIGLVLQELKDSGRANNTLVIFHNDNGGPTTRNAINGSRNTPLRGSKCETFEGGIRVPLLMSWPAVIKPETTYDQSVMTFDLSATALHLADADLTKTDGVNLLPYLSAEKTGSPHEALYWRSRTRNNNHAVLKGDWKFVHSTQGTERPGRKHTPARDMLFNISNDLSEQKDVSVQHPEVLMELKKLYTAWCQEVDADCRKLGIEPPKAAKRR